MCFLSYTTKAQKVTGNKIQHFILILREVINIRCMGYPVCVQDIPYMYGLFTCPIPYGSPICIWEPIRRMGDPYAYGARPFFF